MSVIRSFIFFNIKYEYYITLKTFCYHFQSNYSQGLTCIEDSMSACDPLQILHARAEMLLWIQFNQAVCNFVPQSQISGLIQSQQDIYQCGYDYISMASYVTKVTNYT